MSVRRSWATVLPLLVLAGCVAKTGMTPDQLLPEDNLPPPFAASRRVVMDCPDLTPVTLLLNDNAVRVEAVHAPGDMLRVISASGELYEAGGTEVWLRGDAATFRQPGEDVGRECRVFTVRNAWEAAALRGVAFRAIGQEPGWFVEVLPDKWILAVTDDGRHRLVVPPVAAVNEGDARRFTVNATVNGAIRLLDIVATPATCRDAMSDELFDTQVTLTIDGVVLRGCGRWLAR